MLKIDSAYDNLNIIILPLPRWDGDYSSTIYSLAQEFAKTHRTFYLDNPLTLKDFISGFNTATVQKRKKAILTRKNWYQELSDNLINITTPLSIPTNFLSQSFYDVFQHINNYLVSKTIDRIIREFDIDNYIYINSFNPLYNPSFPKAFPPALKVYHCVDNIAESSYINKHGTRLEDKLITEYDLTITTSKALLNRKSEFSSDVHIIPNAANINHFKQALKKLPLPSELSGIDNPIVTYIGNFEKRIDLDIVYHAINNHPDKVFLFVGPLNIPKSIINHLSSFSNVIVTGPRPFDQIPAYLYYSACTIIPFKINDLTKSIYPLKINEYLATGKPVVSTPFSEDIQDFRDVIEMDSSPVGFSRLIDKAIAEDSEALRKQRIEVASANDWPGRARDFMAIIRQHLVRKIS